MIRIEHDFVLEFSDSADRVVGRIPVTVNWGPAIECARFEAIRLSAVGVWPALARADAWVRPVFSGQAPYSDGFRVSFAVDSPQVSGSDFPLTWFKKIADAGAATLLKQNKLRADETFHYRLLAFEPVHASVEKSPLFSIEEVPAPPVVRT